MSSSSEPEELESAYDLMRPIEAISFGVLLTFQVVYVAYSLLTWGVTSFFRYWSCWNYLFNVVYYAIVVVGRKGFARKIALAITPFMLGLNLLWFSLSLLIVSLGAPIDEESASDNSQSSQEGGITIARIEQLGATGFMHFCPIVATGVYYGFNHGEVRDFYLRSSEKIMRRWPLMTRVVAVGLLFWIPWASFAIYTAIENPVTVYGYNPPNSEVMLGLEAVVTVAYAAVMSTVLFFTFSHRPKRRKSKTEES